jgi:hypothetical protein
MTKPDLKEANLDEDQLVVLTQVTETCKWKEKQFLPFTLLYLSISCNQPSLSLPFAL